jgi:hypothetical protein
MRMRTRTSTTPPSGKVHGRKAKASNRTGESRRPALQVSRLEAPPIGVEDGDSDHDHHIVNCELRH